MMRNVVKKLLIVILGIFMLVPSSVNASLENEWQYDIDLSNSVSSSIVKLEDGIAVMNYEGSASTNNTITKLSYDGKVINSIKNEYGDDISAFEGGLLVCASSKITRLDKDLNVVWTVDATQIGDVALDLNEGFVVLGGSYSTVLTVYDDNGNASGSKDITSVANSLFNNKYFSSSPKINRSLNGDNIIALVGLSPRSTGYSGGVGIIVFSRELEVVESYQTDLNGYDAYKFNGITETDDSYILAGFKTVVMSKDGKIEKKLSTTSFDVSYLDKNIYAYTLNSNDLAYMYDSSFSKYTSKFELIGSKKLPFSFESVNLVNVTGISQVKKKAIFYEDDNDVKAVMLNTPPVDATIYNSTYGDAGKYRVIQYRVGDLSDQNTDNNTNNNDSGIINNITKNPQTNSVVVIIVFVIIIVVVLGIYYFLYRRKSVSKE